MAGSFERGYLCPALHHHAPARQPIPVPDWPGLKVSLCMNCGESIYLDRADTDPRWWSRQYVIEAL